MTEEERVEMSRLRSELADARLLVGILVDRSGGEVRVSEKEIVGAERSLISFQDGYEMVIRRPVGVTSPTGPENP